MSESKKKGKVVPSKTMTPMEALLIGESQALGKQHNQQPTSSSSMQRGSSSDDQDDIISDSDSSDSESDSENDWEEVDDHHVEAQLKSLTQQHNGSSEMLGATEGPSQIPAEGLQIVIPQEGVFRRKSKKEITIEDIIRRRWNSERAELQEQLHKTSLLYQIARGLQLNAAISSELLQNALKERTKGQEFTSTRLDLPRMEKYMNWFRSRMLNDKPSFREGLELSRTSLNDDEFLAYQIMEKTFLDSNYYVLIFAAFLRYFKIEVRLVISFNVIPLKPPSDQLIRKPKEPKEVNEDKDTPQNKPKGRKSNQQGKKTSKHSKSKSGSSKKSKGKSDSSKKSKSKKRGRKRTSSSEDEDEEDDKEKSPKKSLADEIRPGQDMWVEVYLTDEERWVSIDVLHGKVICDKELEKQATRPLTYVLAFSKNNKIKDVTRRYASDWLLGAKKLRVKPDWWEETLKPYRGKRTARDEEEDEYLDQHLLSLPVPKSMSEIKGHPLFVLRRHLLKFEALYPESPPSFGSIKGEPIYSREHVHTLHTRELWMREAKVVRIGEAPYKIVKARPKYDKLSGARLPEVPAELFGYWQTEDFIPPIAQNGKVPRNEWGNVELFTEKLLPQGCVHLRLPGLQRVAKKLDIDCAPAVVGFDFGWGGSKPAFDGFVVCEEFEETLLDAWNQDQDEKKKKDEEKRLQRIYGNWRRLTRGLLLRNRLEQRWSVNLSGKRKAEKTPQPSSSKRAKGK